jgi:hypothetical protein
MHIVLHWVPPSIRSEVCWNSAAGCGGVITWARSNSLLRSSTSSDDAAASCTLDTAVVRRLRAVMPTAISSSATPSAPTNAATGPPPGVGSGSATASVSAGAASRAYPIDQPRCKSEIDGSGTTLRGGSGSLHDTRRESSLACSHQEMRAQHCGAGERERLPSTRRAHSLGLRKPGARAG